MYLEHVNSPEDVRALPASALPDLADEVRAAIIERTSAIGGHTGSNLATVELTIALHRVFETPHDKIVFDVSHQSYAHKMLTGRAAAFLDPTRYAEASGFSARRTCGWPQGVQAYLSMCSCKGRRRSSPMREMPPESTMTSGS